MARSPLPLDPTVEKKLYISGQGSMEFRMPLLVRLRPSVSKRLQELTAGPLYLAVEFAIEELVVRLEGERKPTHLLAASMNATDEDVDLYNQTEANSAKALEDLRERKEELIAGEVQRKSRAAIRAEIKDLTGQAKAIAKRPAKV